MNQRIKNKNIFIILSIVLVLVSLIAAGTYAYWSWQTSDAQRTEIVFTAGEGFSCSVDGGGDITPDEIVMIPSSCTNSERVIKREVTVNANVSNTGAMIHMDLWLDVNSIDQELSESANLKYALTTSSSSCDEGVMMGGTFSNKVAGDKATILMKDFNVTKSEKYYLWIWLDKNETNPETVGKLFNVSLGGECMNSKNDAYAVYSEDDNSLRFYREPEGITVGSNYRGRTATAVYSGIEASKYISNARVPWLDYKSNIINVSVEDVISPVSTAYWFDSIVNCTSIDLSKLDTSKVTDMSNMFTRMNALTSLDLRNFNTSKVTNMKEMFNEMTSLTSLDVSSFDTSNVTNMSAMFKSLSSLTSLDVSSFDTSNVNNMNGMFFVMSSLTSLDLSNFDTSNVTGMMQMFNNMSSLTSLDISSFDTSNVISMYQMFSGVSSLTRLDLTSFDTSNVTDMGYMFAGMNSLTNLEVSSFDTSKVTDMSKMFNNCNKLTSLDLRNFNTINVTNMYAMFQSMSSLTSLDISSFDTSNVTDMGRMFAGLSLLTSLDISNFNTSSVTNMSAMFMGMKKLSTLDFRNADFSNVSNYSNMIANIPFGVEIIVKDNTQKSWITSKFTNLTNVVIPT